MSAIVINAGLVHYESFGRGRPIIFLHGWLGSWRYWMQTMESLAIEHRVYALDLWGFGDSDKSENRFDIENYVSQLAGFITELGINSPILVGHALGAGVAIAYAHRYPENINKIVAVSLPLSAKHINARLTKINQPSLLGKVFRWNPIPSHEIETEAQRTAEYVIPRSLESFNNSNIAEKINTLSCNVLLVYGEKDEVVNPNTVQSLNNSNPRIKSITLPVAKHFPMHDAGSKFNRLLKDFSTKDVSLEDLALKDEWRRRVR